MKFVNKTIFVIFQSIAEFEIKKLYFSQKLWTYHLVIDEKHNGDVY